MIIKVLLRIFLVFVILFSGCVFTFVYDYYDKVRLGSLDSTNNNVEFYVRNSTIAPEKALEGFSEISEKHGVSIRKLTQDYIDGDTYTYYSGVFHEQTYPINQLQILYGHFPASSSQFLASYETFETNQVGTIFDFGQSDHIVIQSLQIYYSEKGLVDGTYQIVADVPFSSVDVINDISSLVGQDREDLLLQSVFSALLPGNEMIYFGVALVIAIITFLLFVVASAILHIKQVGVQKLLGWSNFAILRYVLAGMPVTSVLTIVIVDFFILVLIKNWSIDFLISLITLEVLILLGVFALSLVSTMIIKKQGVNEVIKRSTSPRPIISTAYGLKIGFLILLTLFILQISPVLAEIEKESSAQSLWMDNGEYYVLSEVGLAEGDYDSLASEDTGLDDKFTSLYGYLNLELGGIYAYTEERTTATNPYEIGDNIFYKMTVNPNYLAQFPVRTTDGEEIIINEDVKNRILLIPASLSNETDRYKEYIMADLNGLNQVYSKRHGIDNVNPLNVETIIYDDRNPVFSFNDSAGIDTNYEVDSPIFNIITESNVLLGEKAWIQTSGVNSPFKLNLNGDKKYKLEEYIEKSSLAENRLRFDTIYNCMAETISIYQTALYIMTALLIFVFIAGLIASLLLATVIIFSTKRRIFVLKTLGASMLYTYRSEIIISCLLYAAMLITISLNSNSLVAILISLPVIAVDAGITYFLIYILEKRSIVAQLKGE